jgi:NO-binding membrane sensor protein with MHYT domain
MSFLGAFIGLRCTTRAYAYHGAARARWLLLAAVSIGITGVWVMHFIAMLGYSVAGTAIRYNVAVTIASMLIAVIVVAIGLLIVGFGKPNWRNLLTAGVFTGLGVSSMHYSGMYALQMQASMSYKPALFALSVVIGIVAATAALWAALRLRGMWHTLGAAAIMGVAVSGMHYTGMAAMIVQRNTGPAMVMNGATAEGFLLPLIIGIGVISIIMVGVLLFSPNEAEIREDRELMERINSATARLAGGPVMSAPPSAPAARWPGNSSAWAPGPSQNGGPQNPSHNGGLQPGRPGGAAGPAQPDPNGHQPGANGHPRRTRRSGTPDQRLRPARARGQTPQSRAQCLLLAGQALGSDRDDGAADNTGKPARGPG